MRDLWSSQRAMRAMRQAAIARGVIAALDIGTSKVSCLILRFDAPPAHQDEASHGAHIGGMTHVPFRVIGAATTRAHGVRFGEIADLSKTENAVRTAVQAAQKMAGRRVDHAIVSFSGGFPRSYGLAGEAPLQGTAVRESDVAHALAACEMPELGAGRTPLHAQPVSFTIDHRSGLSDPRGQAGNRLGVDMHLLSVDSHAVHNLVSCIHNADLELVGLVSSAYAAGLSTLLEGEQELGAVCLDMGGGTTGLSIFMKKHMIHASCVRMGGDHITRDIAKALNVPFALAERIKTKHGGLFATSMDDREMIDLGSETGDWGDERRQISRSELIGIIRPRVEEILEDVRALLDAACFEQLPSQQIVLTGGSSQIPGLEGLAARILGPQLRLGRLMRLRGLAQNMTAPSFSSLVGLSLCAAYPQDEWWDFKMPAPGASGRSLKGMLKWFKEHW